MARRLAGALLTLVGVSLLVFFVLRVIPGNQITSSLGTESGVLTPEQLASLRSYYGLNQPLPLQYLDWLASVCTGNLGLSLRSGQSVSAMTAASLPVTLELALLATAFGFVLGVALGMLSASKPNSARDALGQGIGLLALAIPSFVFASALVSYIAAKFAYFPNALPYATPWEDPLLNIQQQMFPALVLGFGVAAPVMRTTRSAIIEVSSLDFVRTARGKGVSPRQVAFRHVLRNAMIPIVTATGIQFGYLLGGAVIVEQIFALPGIGRQVLNGILQREYAVVQSSVLIIAVAFVVVNLLVDVLYRRIDPRVRAE
ncbi:MAG TPA: ABC transporter permease [Candidatus Dormibacteraeota bacterium]